jgi:hypothetical protein
MMRCALNAIAVVAGRSRAAYGNPITRAAASSACDAADAAAPRP